MSTLSNIAIVTLFKISKFKRGALLARSLKQQNSMLKAARFLLSVGHTKGARLLLDKWKLERACYKTALKVQGV